MMKLRTIVAFIVVSNLTNAAHSQLLPVLGAQRAGTATAQFLKIGVGARASAMGESFVAVSNDASALFWNPAGLVQFKEDQAFISHTSWLVDIRHEFFGVVYHLTTEDALGVSVISLQTDDMPVTTEVQPYEHGSYFRYGDVAVGVSYSRKMTTQFSFGGTIRYMNETLDVLRMSGFLVDFGTYYWTGLGTTRFSAVVSNFGNQMSPHGSIALINGSTVSQFQEFSPPTAFKFGFAFEPINEDDQKLTASFQLNHPNDNSENLASGMEYEFLRTFFVRGGYRFNVDEQSFSFGAGMAATISVVHMNVDYGYSAFGILGGVHRLSILLVLK